MMMTFPRSLHRVVDLETPLPVWKSKFYVAFVLNRRVDLHAIDATPARWRGGAGSSPLDRARTAASSPRNDLVKDCRVHPTHWLISTQAHGMSNPFISKVNGFPCGWGQCALDAALRLIAEADRNADGILTRSELAAYDGSVPASCDVGRDWSASAKARGGDWDERAQRKTGLARLCYQLCGNQPVS